MYSFVYIEWWMLSLIDGEIGCHASYSTKWLCGQEILNEHTRMVAFNRHIIVVKGYIDIENLILIGSEMIGNPSR